MNTNGSPESLRRELDRLLEFHRAEVEALHVTFRPDRINKVRDTWVVPVQIDEGPGDAVALNDLLRVIGRSLEAKTSSSVSVLIDPDEE